MVRDDDEISSLSRSTHTHTHTHPHTQILWKERHPSRSKRGLGLDGPGHDGRQGGPSGQIEWTRLSDGEPHGAGDGPGSAVTPGQSALRRRPSSTSATMLAPPTVARQ